MALARVEIPVVATDAAGNVVPNASINIVNRETGVAPTVYQSATGSATRSLPLTTGANGKPPTSWVVRAAYTVTVTADQIGTDTIGWDAATAMANSVEKEWLAAAIQQALWSTGDIKVTSGPMSIGSEPAGWLFLTATPRAVSRTTYADLFAFFGGTDSPYGLGTDSSKFLLPKGGDVVLIGASSARPIGGSGGEAAHTLTIDEMPSHDHPSRDGGSFVTYGAGGGLGVGGGSNANALGLTSTRGGGSAHNNMPPYQSVGGYLIKT